MPGFTMMDTIDERWLSSNDERESFASCWVFQGDGMDLRNAESELCGGLHGLHGHGTYLGFMKYCISIMQVIEKTHVMA